MTTLRKVTGRKHRTFTEPVKFVLNHGNRAVVHRIEDTESVLTPDGLMMLARLTNVTNLFEPDCDIAMLVGKAPVYRSSGAIDPGSPELWFYNDNFWVKARGSDGTPYYVGQRWLLYTVEVDDVERLWATVKTGFEQKEPQE